MASEKRRSLNHTATVLFSICLMTGVLTAPAYASTSKEKCPGQSIEGSTNERNEGWNITGFCSRGARPDLVAEPAADDRTSQTSSSAERPNPIRVTSIDGCYEDQLANPDFRDCMNQAEEFCGPDGQWRQVQFVDTSKNEEDDEYRTFGQRFCAPDSGPGSPDGTGEALEAFDLNDVAGLITIAPRVHADNGGRGIRNAHTNFYSDALTIVQETTLNGEYAILRATPIEYQWNYGDGTTRTTEVAGSSQSEFNVETATSHRYEETGTYTVNLSTVFMGEYSLDGGQTWIRIDGTITRESDPLVADIFRSVTRNVADDCITNPGAWGCGAPGGGTPTPSGG